MCGIVGYVGQREAAPIILEGLSRLEYRGYDSAGIAVLNGKIHVRRDVGKLHNLRQRLDENPVNGTLGIGHTRWATHGIPAEHNAHPHLSMNGQFVVVHNGIVENYLELRQTLTAAGVVFNSETDTEVIVQLVEQWAQHGISDLTELAQCVVQQLRGAHAIVLMSKAQPDRLVAVRIGNAGGVAIGIGQNEYFIASDMPAILEYTDQMIFLEHRQIATITAQGCSIKTLENVHITPEIHIIPHDPISAAKGEYRHFMQKEIYEQPRSITDTLGGRIDFEHGRVILGDLNLTPDRAQSLKRLVTVACGTSYYSGLVGKFYIEQLARLTVEVDYASEFRYRDPLMDAATALLAITQSGETVDTLAAIEEARTKNALVWSIVNAIGSQAMRVSDGVITMNAGPEIGVASTKAFTTSIVDQYLLALYLAQWRGTLTPEQLRCYIQDAAQLPNLISRALEQEKTIQALAEKLCDAANFLYLGRGIQYPIALEGALKLKEISYIHAEGYPAGEMKHGPIALIDDKMPVLAIALQDALYEKMISQIEQAKARGGRVIALATEDDTFIATRADEVIYLPPMPPLLSPIVSVIPLQLLAYHIALLRGADVDQPRNLAKSVTVE
jgi:glucosamine--fructose-6-phosphate aminotransferase (isomerizing)